MSTIITEVTDSQIQYQVRELVTLLRYPIAFIVFVATISSVS